MNKNIYLLLLVIVFHNPLIQSSNANNESTNRSLSLQSVKNNAWPIVGIGAVLASWYAAANNNILNLPSISLLIPPSITLPTPIINTENFVPFLRKTLLSTEGLSTAWSTLSKNYGANPFTLSLLGASATIFGLNKWLSYRKNPIVNTSNNASTPIMSDLGDNNSINSILDDYTKVIQNQPNIISAPTAYISLLDKISKKRLAWLDEPFANEFMTLLNNSYQDTTVKNTDYTIFFKEILDNIYEDDKFNPVKLSLMQTYVDFIEQSLKSEQISTQQTRIFINRTSLEIILRSLNSIPDQSSSEQQVYYNEFVSYSLKIISLMTEYDTSKLYDNVDTATIGNIINTIRDHTSNNLYELIGDIRKKLKNEKELKTANNYQSAIKTFNDLKDIAFFEYSINEKSLYRSLLINYQIGIRYVVSSLLLLRKSFKEKLKENLNELERKYIEENIQFINHITTQQDIDFIFYNKKLNTATNEQKKTIYKKNLQFFKKLWKLVRNDKTNGNLKLDKLFDKYLCQQLGIFN